MTRKKTKGFTLVEIMISVMIILILMQIAVPNYIKSRNTGRKNSCIAYLRQIDSAKQQYQMENMLDSGAAVTSPNLVPTYIKAIPTCPAGGTYTLGVVNTDPSCSLSTSAGHKIP